MAREKKYTPEDFKQYLMDVKYKIKPNFEETVRSGLYIPNVTPNEVIAYVTNPQTEVELDFANSFWETLDLLQDNRLLFNDPNVFNFENSKAFNYIKNYFEMIIDFYAKCLEAGDNDERIADLEIECAEKEFDLCSDLNLYYGNKTWHEIIGEFSILMLFYKKQFIESIRTKFKDCCIVRDGIVRLLAGAPEDMEDLQVLYFMSLDSIMSKKIEIQGVNENEESKFADAFEYFKVMKEYVSHLQIQRKKD